jgi:Na+-driven multidrug efflux pump
MERPKTVVIAGLFQSARDSLVVFIISLFVFWRPRISLSLSLLGQTQGQWVGNTLHGSGFVYSVLCTWDVGGYFTLANLGRTDTERFQTTFIQAHFSQRWHVNESIGGSVSPTRRTR